jgi:cytoskeletal protein CcmA (bactofilin family)
MAYGGQTPIYQIPYPLLGDATDPDSEQRKAYIITNQLYGAIRAHSGGHGWIRLGKFDLANDGAGNYNAIMYESKATGNIFEAFINQIYVYNPSALRWRGLTNPGVYYLYVRLVEDGTNSSLLNKQVQTDYNTTGIVPSDGILVAVCIIDEPGNSNFLTGDNIKDMVRIPILGDHINNNQNPHTPYLMQDEIVVSGLTTLDQSTFRNLQVENLTISGNSIISGNILVLGNLTLSGNVAINGVITYNLVQTENLTVPGNFNISYLIVTSGMDVYPTSYFRNNIVLNSGVTVDGLDPSVALPLVNGSNADNLHGHVLGSLAQGNKPLYFTPEYPNTVVSGEDYRYSVSGIWQSGRYYNDNFYQWYAGATSKVAIPVTKMILPSDFESIDRLTIKHGVGYLGSGNKIVTEVYDKDQTLIASQLLKSQQVTSTDIIISGGQFGPNLPLTIANKMIGSSGVGTWLGEMTLLYVPIAGEKIVFDWNYNGDASAAVSPIDNIRQAPADLKIEKVLVSESIALSGSSIFNINVGNINSTPTNIFQTTSKPSLSFGSTGASFQGAEKFVLENQVISRNQIITAGFDQLASGSRDVCIQLITHRM